MTPQSAQARISPAYEKNYPPILGVLERLLAPPHPHGGHRQLRVLELGSGPGQHIASLARDLPHVDWWPAELPENLPSIHAWRAQAALPNLHPPRPIDLCQPDWHLPFLDDDPYDLIMSVNVIHASRPEVHPHLIAGAAPLLAPEGILWFYGPFRFPDTPLTPSNEAFDASLKARGPGWGIRDTDRLDTLAADAGLTRAGVEALPSNNHALWWRKAGG